MTMSSTSLVRQTIHMILGALGTIGFLASAQATPICKAPVNLIPNPGFEHGPTAAGSNPDHWYFESWSGTGMGTWDSTTAHQGQRSVRIDAGNPDDAKWLQSVIAPVNTPVFLSGWIRSHQVKRVDPSSPGATISSLGRWDQPPPTLGTTPWHQVGMTFISDTSPLLIAPRLGFWGGLATGTAWYDDLSLVPRLADTPHPRWKILVLIYPQTDFSFTDAKGVNRHVAGQTSPEELDETEAQAKLFVEKDIPALSSGNMLPSVTVRRVSQPLRSLSRVLDGWWPAQGDVTMDLDPSFDSVIVIWEPRVRDQATGESLWIGAAAGLTPDRGLGQTYVTMSVEYAGVNGHRNVYKHEWGHSILSYFQALQVTSMPSVNNHAEPSQYVNCRGKPPYVWEDETNAAPIPNSIYSNSAGFTHDYYSGTVALASEPDRCLGIGPAAWAWGGPATHSGSQPVFTVMKRIEAIAAQVDGFKTAGMLDHRSARALSGELLASRAALSWWHSPNLARTGLRIFIKHVQALVKSRHITAEVGELLQESANSALACAS